MARPNAHLSTGAVAAPDVAASTAPGRAAALMVGALFILSFQDSLVKLLSDDLSLWQFTLIRAVFNLSFLLALGGLLWRSGSWRPRRAWAVAMRSGFLAGAMVLFFGGIPFLSLAEIAAGMYVFPLFVAALSAGFLGESVGPRRVLAIMVGFAGALLMLKPGGEAFQWASLMPVGAALFYAGMVITTRRLCRDEHPATLALGVSISFVLVGAVGLATMEAIGTGDWTETWPYLLTGWRPLALATLGLILVCSALNLASNIALAKAYQSAESSWLAPFDYSYLVFAAFWSYAMWDQPPDVWAALGMSMIAGAGIFVAWREHQEKRRPAVRSAV